MNRVGDIIGGKYEITGELGSGGMGVVYEARHLDINRRVALKVLRAERSHDERARERFAREARAAGQIEQENICEVLDFGQSEEGELFLTMPLLEGATLKEVLREQGPLSVERVCDIAEQTLLALDAAHARGVFHRDLKPDNLFLTRLAGRRDFVKILDFGVSKLVAPGEVAGETLTESGALLGTPHYMSPEQARGARDLDGRSDFYSLGAVMFEALTGVKPVEGESANEVLWSIWNRPIPALRSLRPELPRGLEAFLNRALARERELRFADAAAMRRALGEALTDTDECGDADDSIETCDDTVGLLGAGDATPSVGVTPARAGRRSRRPLSRRTLGVLTFVGVSLFIFAVIAPSEHGVRRSAATVIGAVEQHAGGDAGTVEVLSPAASIPEAAVDEGSALLEAGERLEPPSTDGGTAGDGGDAPLSLTLRGLPAEALITVDGASAEGPLVQVNPADSPVDVVVRAEGWQPWRKRIDLREDMTVQVRMKRRRAQRREGEGQEAQEDHLVDRFGEIP